MRHISRQRRRNQIAGGVSPRFAFIGGILRNKDCVLVEGNGTANHVHLLIGLPPKYAPSDILRDLKANTSRWIHQKWPKHSFTWQDGYAVFSVSISKIPRTREYIRDQKEHHKKTTFRQELQWFLDNHDVQYDPKFLPQDEPGASDEPPMPPPSGARDSDPM
jgi:putative transposase